MWRRVALLVASTLASLLAVEAGLRLVGLGTPVLYENRAACGYRPRPDQTRRRIGGATVHVNHLGLRGPDVAATPPPGALRLLFLGDSVTWGGSYIDDRDLFATVAGERVRQRLSGRFAAVEALDAGVNAWGPENVLGLLRESGGFASHVWVWILLDDDFVREKTHFGEVPYFAVAPWSAWEELLVLASYKIVTRYKGAKPAADAEAIATRNLAVCREAAALARSVGARLVLAWHPAASELAGGAARHAPALRDLAMSEGIPFVDLGPSYRRTREPAELYVDGMHLTRAGHRVVGEALAEQVIALVGNARP
jgi:lysophospholipase L1-like esterase